jgi:hypothetical protein
VTGLNFEVGHAEIFGIESICSGTFNHCTGGMGSFGGGGGTASGTFNYCTGGRYSLGSDVGTASGTFNYCTGGGYSFGSRGTASGTFNYCIGGEYSFAGDPEIPGTLSGQLYFCRLTVGDFLELAEGCSLRACIDSSGFIAERDYDADV